jgi:hypothetical protein
MSDTERFRKEAENCLRLDAESANAIDRKALLWMAEEWLRLTEAAQYLNREGRVLLNEIPDPQGLGM